MRRTHIALVLALALAVFVFAAFGADAAAGKELYAKKCRVCHGADGAPPPAILKANPGMKAFTSAEFQAQKDAEIKKKTTDLPKHKVPAKGLTEADLDNLVAFMRTLKK